MNNNSAVKSLMDSALLAAMAFILLLIGNFLGFTLLTTAIAFIPMALIYIKYNLKFWILGNLVVFILEILFIGVINAILLIIPVVIYSLIYGYSVKKNKSGNRTFLYLLIGSIISSITTIALYIYIFLNISLSSFIETYIIGLYKPIIEESAKILGNSGNAYLVEMTKFLTVKNIMIILPTVLIIYAFIATLISISIAKQILKRINIKVNSIETFDKWYIDPKIAAILIIVSIIGVLLSQNGLKVGNSIIISSFVLLFVIYAIQGMSLIYSLITKNTEFKSKNIIILMIVSIIFIGSYAVGFLGILGLVDLIMDTRGLNEHSLIKIIKGKIE